MSKTLKQLIVKDYTARFTGTTDGMLISIRGMKGKDTTKLRQGLHKKQIKVTVVRNALAKQAIKGTALEPLAALLDGPAALAFGGNSVVEVAREIVSLLRDFPMLELKGAVLDGTLFKGDAGVKELSKFPTKAEAVANAVTLIISPGRTLAAALNGPGSTIAGIVKTIESRLEKGEAIARKA